MLPALNNVIQYYPYSCPMPHLVCCICLAATLTAPAACAVQSPVIAQVGIPADTDPANFPGEYGGAEAVSKGRLKKGAADSSGGRKRLTVCVSSQVGGGGHEKGACVCLRLHQRAGLRGCVKRLCQEAWLS